MGQAVQVVLIILIAFFAYMHSYMGSTMHNRPIVVAPLVGLVLGDWQTGVIIGATLELVFMGAFPVGASNPPDFVSGTIISTAYVILSGSEVTAAVVLAVPIATLVLLFDNIQMTFVLTWASHIADKYAEAGDIKGVERVQILFGIGNKVVLALVVGLGYMVGVPVIEKILSYVPEFVTYGLDVADRFCHAGKNDDQQEDGSFSDSWFPAGSIPKYFRDRHCAVRSGSGVDLCEFYE